MQLKRNILTIMAGLGFLVLLAGGLLLIRSSSPSGGRSLPPSAALDEKSVSSDARSLGNGTPLVPNTPVDDFVPPMGSEGDARFLLATWRTQAPDNELLDLYEAILVPPDPGIYKSRHDADLNELMNQLCEQEADPVRLSRFFIAIMQDEARDIVLRDYAIQHLRIVCRSLLGEENTTADWTTASETACNALIEVAEAQPCCLAGTSLLALAELAENTQLIETERVARMALERAGDVQTHEGIRLTALLVCAQLNNTDAIPVALDILDTSDQLSLRLAAISALGALGNQDILMQMELMRTGLDETEQNAMGAAIRKISGRRT